MAISIEKHISMLDDSFVLLPERYDPRRDSFKDGIPLLDIVNIGSETITHIKAKSLNYLSLDTTNSFNGFISVNNSDFNKLIESTKKVVQKNSVIISRLRPYLRQVGFVDNAIVPNDEIIITSSEYYELIPKGKESIAFLIPFLLSADIQSYLQHSIEGGNHPRFKLDALTKILIPNHIYNKRNEISLSIENSIAILRDGYKNLDKAFIDVEIYNNPQREASA